MSKLGALVKMVRGITTPEEMLELLDGIGVEVKFQPVTETVTADDFAELGRAAADKGNKAFLVNGKDSEGRKISAFIILHPTEPK